MKATPAVRTVASSAYEIPAVVMHRAITKSTFDPETGCFVSSYSVGSHGYAQIGWSIYAITGGKKGNAGTTAHRAAWTAVHGPIPEGMTIDHLCKNRRCVNPAHLRMVSNYENARRTSGRDWPMGQCANGHSNEHLRNADGGRRVRCGICSAEQQRRYRNKRWVA